jgi:hypothetical protein
MLIEIQPHYLDLIVRAIEETKHACLHQKINEQGGKLWIMTSETNTVSVACLAYQFDDAGVALSLQFRDNRPPVNHRADFVGGVDGFFAKLVQAIYANRLGHTKAAA